MDIIRHIALETAAMPYGKVLAGLDGVSQEVFALHAIWMNEAGLITATINEYASGETPAVHVLRLTWDGCEFADAIADKSLWQRAKENILKPGASFTFDILRTWIKAEIAKSLPPLV